MGSPYMQNRKIIVYHKSLEVKGGSEKFNILLYDFFKNLGFEYYIVVKNISPLWQLELNARGIRYIEISSLLDLLFLCLKNRCSHWLSSSGALDLALIKLILWRLSFTFLEHEVWVFEESNRALTQKRCRHIFKKCFGRDDWPVFSKYFPNDNCSRLFYLRKFLIVKLATTTQLLTNISLQEKNFVMPHDNYRVSSVPFINFEKKRPIGGAQRERSDCVTIVWVGRNVAKKRLPQVLDILASLVPTLDFEIVLHIVSPLDLQYIDPLSLGFDVQLHIGLGDGEMEALVSQCDLMINSDVSDFVLTVVEALSHRVPCLVGEFFDISMFPPDSPLVQFEFEVDSLHSAIERGIEFKSWDDSRWIEWELEVSTMARATRGW